MICPQDRTNDAVSQSGLVELKLYIFRWLHGALVARGHARLNLLAVWRFVDCGIILIRALNDKFQHAILI